MERVVIALGGNALLQRGEADTAEAMRRSARTAAEVIADICADAADISVVDDEVFAADSKSCVIVVRT